MPLLRSCSFESALFKLPKPDPAKHASELVWLVALAFIFSVCCSRQPARKHSPEPPLPSSPVGQVLAGRVVAISDGDTITVLDAANKQHRIRLAAIDAPEAHQAFGEQARRSLAGRIFGKDVSVSYQKVDPYGRIVGQVRLDGQDINLEQIKSGLAWHYKYHQNEQTPEDRGLYARAEDEARAARRGLWQDSNPVEPYQFRREKKDDRQDAR